MKPFFLDKVIISFERPLCWRLRVWLAAQLGVQRGSIRSHLGRVNFYDIDFGGDICVRRIGSGLLIAPYEDRDWVATLDEQIERAQTPERLIN